MELINAADCYRLHQTTFSFQQEVVVMGILNVTPDSFSDGGHYTQLDAALYRAEQMLQEGAKIIDIGGESTRPGHQPVGVEEELERTAPIIEAITQQLGCVVSIDTYKGRVAEAAIQAGASIINDVWGAKKDPSIAQVAAQAQVPIILMHNQEVAQYEEFMPEVLQGLMESVELVKRAGVLNENIWLDPGVGFAKDTKQNLQVMREMEAIKQLGYPVLLGTSRKSVIGNVLRVPVEERLIGSLATVGFGLERGAHLVRVHDVKETVQFVKMYEALRGRRE